MQCTVLQGRRHTVYSSTRKEKLQCALVLGQGNTVLQLYRAVQIHYTVFKASYRYRGPTCLLTGIVFNPVNPTFYDFVRKASYGGRRKYCKMVDFFGKVFADFWHNLKIRRLPGPSPRPLEGFQPVTCEAFNILEGKTY